MFDQLKLFKLDLDDNSLVNLLDMVPLVSEFQSPLTEILN